MWVVVDVDGMAMMYGDWGTAMQVAQHCEGAKCWTKGP